MILRNQVFLSVLVLATAGCTVSERTVKTSPPTIPDFAMAFASSEGQMQPMSSAVIFLWPNTKNGRPITEVERKNLVSTVDRSAREMNEKLAAVATLSARICTVKEQMFNSNQNCLAVWKDAPYDGKIVPLPAKPCDYSWVTDWVEASADDVKTQGRLKQCQDLQTQGTDLDTQVDQANNEVTAKYMALQAAIDQDTPKGAPLNWKTTDAADSIIKIQRTEDNKTVIRIAFSFEGIRYDSDIAVSEAEGGIDQMSYDFAKAALSFTLHQPKTADGAGGVYTFKALERVGNVDVKFGGKVYYSGYDGSSRDGRASFSGKWLAIPEQK